MGEISYHGQQWTWKNNWQGEEYIEFRLDRFFGSLYWLLNHDRAVVTHVANYSSDHIILLLDTKPVLQIQKKKRFCFDKRWIGKAVVEEVIKEA